MLRVEELKRNVIIGEVLLVPCLINSIIHNISNDIKLLYFKATPVINHPHNDIENGQVEIHYHTDFRFLDSKNSKAQSWIYKGNKYFLSYDPRPIKSKSSFISYIPLRVENINHRGITPSQFIKNTKLKHKCIHKGKCPHRGYNLSNTEAKDGVITCPLHGLQFDEITKKIINAPQLT